jgi:hypothetical protein
MSHHTNLLDPQDFLIECQDSIVNKIRERMDKELRPLADKIYSEELAKFALELTTFVSVERFGYDLRIVLKIPEKKEQK